MCWDLEQDPQDPLTWPSEIAFVPNRLSPQYVAEYAVPDFGHRGGHPGMPEV